MMTTKTTPLGPIGIKLTECSCFLPRIEDCPNPKPKDCYFKENQMKFEMDEHNCLTIQTENGRFHFFLTQAQAEELGKLFWYNYGKIDWT